jgi:anti-sigma regulatory factor (Ser/Thr protein kinase)
MVQTAGEWSMVVADAREALRARQAIRRFLKLQAARDSDLDGAETIAGELIANVIRHAPGPVGIHVFWKGDGATLIIMDRGPGIPHIRKVPDALSTSGRGLFLVQALARRVEIDTPPSGGSRILVELPVCRRAKSRS